MDQRQRRCCHMQGDAVEHSGVMVVVAVFLVVAVALDGAKHTATDLVRVRVLQMPLRVLVLVLRLQTARPLSTLLPRLRLRLLLESVMPTRAM